MLLAKTRMGLASLSCDVLYVASLFHTPPALDHGQTGVMFVALVEIRGGEFLEIIRAHALLIPTKLVGFDE